MGKSVLVIDDDEKLNNLLKDYLSKFGFKVTTAIHPDDGLDILEQELPDIIILDIMLPDKDGFEVCKEIRKTHSVPILMLTARGEVTDRIVGLELGADDYLPKPFEPRELVARIQSILRRSKEILKTDKIKIGSLIVDLNKQTVKLNGKSIDLTTMEFEMLTVFVKNSGSVLTRDRIMNKTHDMDWEAFNRTVDVLVSRLRQKLGDDPKNPNLIKTVWGKGYKFIGDEDDSWHSEP
ncbi:response regulator transcription factor [candidate division KSB1 bacterium]|nr:response regulator transcription factor [candidate division KSB1 bacterium]MBL7094023.1 response regulator transcription factor [candidate division KSB1 bacterium]